MPNIGSTGLSIQLGGGSGGDASDINITPVGNIVGPTVQDAISQLNTQSMLQLSPITTLNGNAAVDLNSIPTGVDEINFYANGASGSLTAAYFLQAITPAGVATGSIYFNGIVNNLASSSTYSLNNPGSNILVLNSVPNTAVFSAFERFIRQTSTSWMCIMHVFSGDRMTTSFAVFNLNPETSITGIRFGATAGTFDNGVANLSWRY